MATSPTRRSAKPRHAGSNQNLIQFAWIDARVQCDELGWIPFAPGMQIADNFLLGRAELQQLRDIRERDTSDLFSDCAIVFGDRHVFPRIDTRWQINSEFDEQS